MKSTSTAEAISAQLLALLPQHPAEATVHSVFHTSANLLYQEQLVTLLDDTRPLYPCAVRLGGSIPPLAVGEPALLSQERITFPHSGHTIELHRAAVTSLSLFSPLLPLQLPHPAAPQALREIILSNGKPGGSIPPLAVGEPALLSQERITFPHSGHTIELHRAAVTSLSLFSPLLPLQLPHPAAPQALREIILSNGKPEGFAPLFTILEDDPSPLPDNLYVRYAAERIPALFAALRQKDAEVAAEAAYSIAGCGIGLSPSADDFLCGVMASVLASAIARGEQNKWLPLTAAMAERAAPRTNLISPHFCGRLPPGSSPRMCSLSSEPFIPVSYRCGYRLLR